jgi:hypothetical protein|tara:strand:- start:2116 stop:2517 length:402 start_codon:yes stop_codon:yes gene_type:complete
MSDKIGVLGEATVATAATTTVYTVPSGKAARCKIMWAGASHASTATGDLTITVNGINVAVIIDMTAARFLHSNSTLLVNPETAAAPTGATALLTVSPAPFEYFLSAGDTVTYTIGTLTMAAMNMQVVGTEIDV